MQLLYAHGCSHGKQELRSAASTGQPTSPTVVTDSNALSGTKSGQGFPPIRPVVTAPQPLKPLDRRPSQSAGPTRNRSPSTSTALQDLAHQGAPSFFRCVITH
jgi:hypothetical protein